MAGVKKKPKTVDERLLTQEQWADRRRANQAADEQAYQQGREKEIDKLFKGARVPEKP